jgi:hypothetical protein
MLRIMHRVYGPALPAAILLIGIGAYYRHYRHFGQVLKNACGRLYLGLPGLKTG